MDSAFNLLTTSEKNKLLKFYNESRASSKMSGIKLGENFSLNDLAQVISESRISKNWLPPNLEILVISLYVATISFGLVSNGLVCFVVCQKKQLRKSTNLFIFNLALSDVLMCLLSTPFTVMKLLLKTWYLGDIMCKVVPWLQGVVVFASTLTITAIALDRYYIIIFPSKGQDYYKKVVIIMSILLIWLVSAFISLPLMINSEVQVVDYIDFVTFRMCLEVWPSSNSRFAYGCSVMLLQFIIPIAMLLTMHWKICNFLKYRIAKDPRTMVEVEKAVKDAKRHRKNTTLLMAIAVMFALCWFPLTLLNLMADFNYHIFMSQNFIISYSFAHLIATLSACLNPILYGWFNTNFRKEYSSYICFWKKAEEPSNDDVIEQIDEQVILYKRQISYKAIQTEVQPQNVESTSPLRQCRAEVHGRRNSMDAQIMKELLTFAIK